MLHVSVLLMTKIVTFNRTIESLYEELVKEGILVQYPKVKIADYMGEYRFTDNTIYCLKAAFILITIFWQLII